MGLFQITAGIIALVSAWKGNWMWGLAAVGVILLIMSYHHLQAKGHKFLVLSSKSL